MNDYSKSKDQLIAELADLRQQLTQLELASARDGLLGEPTWDAVVSSAPVFFTLLARDGTLLYLNHAQPGMTVNDAIGKTAYDFTMPEYHSVITDSLVAAFEERRNTTFTSVAAGPDGRKSWYETHVAPVLSDGNVRAASFVAIDITARKIAEMDLQEERVRAQEYVNIAGVILLALNADGRIRLLNRTGHRLLGYEDGELIGRNWFQFVPERQRDEIAEVLRQLMAGDLAPMEYYENPVVTRDGEQRIIAWHNRVLTDGAGNRIGTLSSGTDITEQSIAQEALRKAHEELERRVEQRTEELTAANRQLVKEIEERRDVEQQLQAIYDGLVDGMLVISIERKVFVRVNAAICEMLGYHEEDLLGKPANVIHPEEDFPHLFEKFNAFAQLDPESTDEPLSMVAENVPMLHKNGTVFYVDISASHIDYGGDRCLIGFFHDITDRRIAEERLQREHRVLRDLLSSQDRERQLIAYEIHDGLAQKLVGAIMQFETVNFQAAKDSDGAMETCATGLRMLRGSLSEARRLIGGLRPPILDELGVVAAIGHIVHEMMIPGEGPKISYTHDVHFDRLHPTLENTIYRVTQECLTNAQRYSQSEQIRVELLQNSDFLRVIVTDWGVGFDPTDERGGRFGLEGIKERARLLGGVATVNSAPGEGTQITVELPLSFEETES